MSKVKKITVSNLKAISDLTADFNGCTAIITGGNNKGKSSFLKSLPDRLKSIKPDVILKEGATEGYAEWELTTGEKLIWQFDKTTKKGEKLIFITKDNIKTALTSELASRYFPKGFDIDQFIKEGPKKQREVLQKIVGLDFTEIDTRYKQAYENRTFANRDLEVARGKLTPINEDMDEEPLDILEIQKQIAAIDGHNDRYTHVTTGLNEKTSSQEECQIEITRIQSEIERLESLITVQKDKISNLQIDIDKGNEWLEVEANKPKSEEFKIKLNNSLLDTQKTNVLIEDNNKAKLTKKAFEEAEILAKNADKIVKEIEVEKTDLIKSAELPVGFGFTDEGITYLGHSFTKEQLSSSAIYIAALKLASLNIGEVKTLHFDASYLDKNSLSEIETWAQMNDLQLLIERPDFEGGDIEYHLIENVIS
ncbi:hypothetical protein [Sphingobacterium faecium]|uniref:hypothetical protein n=1 Tax=Sphingobacterium faecium TaxID=34087 RepID=UPI002469BEAA|nr:hypothetical protein [Sphingobacterium faecium]MDH5825806.1 hypothetical protein [Sphingobacterium faecium]